MSVVYNHICCFLLSTISFLGFAQDKADGFSQIQIPFEVLKINEQDLDIANLFSSDSLFKINTSFEETTHPDESYIIRLDFYKITKVDSTSSTNYLKFNTFGHGKLYYLKSQGIVSKPIGKFDKNSISHRVKSEKYYSEVSFNTSQLVDGRYLFFVVKRVQFFENINQWTFSYYSSSVRNSYTWNDVKSVSLIYIFIGICIVMSVFMLVFFSYFKRLEFLFYFFYVFGLLIYLSKDELLLFDSFLTNNLSLSSWLLEDIAIFIGISYMLFTIYYLDLKRDYKFAFYVFKISLVVHLLLLIIDAYFYITQNYEGHLYILKSFPIIDSVSALLANVYILLNIKNRISVLYIIGSVIFMLGVAHYFYFNMDLDPLNYDKRFITIGSAIEIMIFAYGLTYKVHIEHVEKLRYQKEALTNKTKALRAQINPHFIFNSLSSIQHLVTINDKASVLKYLSKFSRLTRNILESSIETNVVLNDEIKMLTDYLELESLRFNQAFTYNIKIDDNINANAVEIPFMILQPFVENAIIHGLLPKKEGNKNLSILFKKETNLIFCEIDDNGIGRHASSLKKNIHEEYKKSRGLEVTKQRLETHNKNFEAIQIIDKKDKYSQSLGTKVIIKILINL